MANCILCGSSNVQDIFRIDQIPVYCNQIFTRREEAIAIKKGNLDLKHCGNCDHVFNADFDDGLMDYNASYDASLDFSAGFRAFMSKLADDLIRENQLENKIIVEIACGKGRFLTELAGKAKNTYLGFDPSFEGGADISADVKIYPQYYDDSAVELINAIYGGNVDFAICRHALEHVEKPLDMVKGLYQLLSKNPQAEVYFEVPNALFMVRDLSIWDFIYEHVSYFSAKSLTFAFENAGFNVENCVESYQGQFLSLNASVAADGNPTAEHGSSAEYIGPVRDQLQSIVDNWDSFLEKSDGKTVLWGAGSKGVTFLNLITQGDKVSAIVDINPNKIGKFAPGTGHQIIAKEALAELQPSTVIIMNPIYRQEIALELDRLGVGARVLGVEDNNLI